MVIVLDSLVLLDVMEMGDDGDEYVVVVVLEKVVENDERGT